MAYVILNTPMFTSIKGGTLVEPDGEKPVYIPDEDIAYLMFEDKLLSKGGNAPEVDMDPATTLRDLDELRQQEEAIEEVKTAEKKGPGRPRKDK